MNIQGVTRDGKRKFATYPGSECDLPVQITYDVEIGGAIQMKEIPFVVGVLGDLSGNPDYRCPN